MLSGAGTTGTISIKFRGTKNDSDLLKFKTGLAQGSIESIPFTINDIGGLTFVYLEIDSTDTWRFASISIQINGSPVMFFDDSFILRADTTASIWLSGFFFSFFLFFSCLFDKTFTDSKIK